MSGRNDEMDVTLSWEELFHLVEKNEITGVDTCTEDIGKAATMMKS